jgi:hypothetical protein
MIFCREEYGKKEIGSSADVSPKATRRKAVWIENGTWYGAPRISSRKFGVHAYMVPGAFDDGARDCPCGCWMTRFDSGGPCDPYGPCPKNPCKRKDRSSK